MWVDVFGYRPLRNTSGRAYRALPADRQSWEGEEWTSAFATDPMLIRRPVVEVDGKPFLVGFKPEVWSQRFGLLQQ